MAVLATVASAAAGAAEPSAAGDVHPEFLTLPTARDLELHLQRRTEALRKGDQTAAELELENILRLREALGLRSLAALGTALRIEARQALAAGDHARGLERLEHAAVLIPDVPGVHYELARARFEHGEDKLAALGSFGRGVQARAEGLENRSLLLSDALGVLGATWLLSLAVFLLFQLVRYLDMAGHDVSRLLPGISRLQGRLLVLLALSAPVALGLGLLPLLALGLVLVGLYQTRSERLLTVTGLTGLLGLAALIYLLAPVISFRDSDARAIYVTAARSASADLRARVESIAETQPEAAFVLGLEARRRGDLERAERWYRKSLEGGRGAARLNNLANVLVWRQKSGEAQKLYREAAQLEARAEPALNLSAVLLEEGQASDARIMAEQGRRLDPALAELMRVDVAGVPAVRKLRDAPHDEQQLLPMLLESMSTEARLELLDDLTGRLLGGVPLAWFGGALVLAVALLLALGGGPRATSTACTRCGAPALRTAEPHCESCRFVFLEASAADPKVRFEKEQAIRRRRRYERWREKISSVVAGGGELVTGHPLVGFALLFLLCLSVAHVAWLERYGFYPWAGWSEPEPARWLVSGLLAGAVTLISLRRGFGG